MMWHMKHTGERPITERMPEGAQPCIRMSSNKCNCCGPSQEIRYAYEVLRQRGSVSCMSRLREFFHKRNKGNKCNCCGPSFDESTKGVFWLQQVKCVNNDLIEQNQVKEQTSLQSAQCLV